MEAGPEPGGSDAYMAVADADAETADAAAVRPRFTNYGQCCVREVGQCLTGEYLGRFSRPERSSPSRAGRPRVDSEQGVAAQLEEGVVRVVAPHHHGCRPDARVLQQHRADLV
ncbi:hypothetical protein ABZ490_44705 [Streptomyces sp. NPDC005811]|uniref:hypothetical protein n=1 Tax=Streptomyces sp. NPDC005811 TaxID=3154565 RepID=UPI0033D7FC6A